jgi:hypothetical protein
LGNHLLFYSSYALPNITSIAVAALNAHVIIMPNTNQRTRSTVEDVGFATQFIIHKLSFIEGCSRKL